MINLESGTATVFVRDLQAAQAALRVAKTPGTCRDLSLREPPKRYQTGWTGIDITSWPAADWQRRWQWGEWSR